VQQFTEIFNKDTLGDSTAAKSSRSCITRATVEKLKSQAAGQLKQTQPAAARNKIKGNDIVIINFLMNHQILVDFT
jgi:hypothetical protein